jgi:hypothetical protein
MDPLSQQILALEGQFWKTSGAKDAAIKELGLSPVRYYQLLSQLIQSEDALSADPVLVKRLRRIARCP